MDQNAEPSPLSPTAPTLDYQGYIEGVRGTEIGGWAVDTNGQPCELRIIVNGTMLETRSDRPRPDLVDNDLSTGAGGWSVDAQHVLIDGENHIEAYFPSGMPLGSSPKILEMVVRQNERPRPVTYRGAIDIRDAPRLHGWAVTSEKTATQLTVTIEGQPPFVVLSNWPRHDLAQHGISNGEGGWLLDVEDLLQPGRNIIHLTLPDGKALSGSPITIDRPGAELVPAPSPAAISTPVPEAAVAPAPVVSPSPAPVKATPVPEPQADRPLTLSELDEVSIEDLVDAVAAGLVDVQAPPPPPEIEEVAPPAPAPAIRQRDSKPGFFARLFGKKGG